MSKKKKLPVKRAKVLPKKQKPKLEDYTLEQLVTMPTKQVIGLMKEDPTAKDFAESYDILMEVCTFLGRYGDLQNRCMESLMRNLKKAGCMDGNNILSMNQKANTTIQQTTNTTSYQKLMLLKAMAETMRKKLEKAESIIEAAFEAHPELDSFRKTIIRNVLYSTKIILEAKCFNKEEDGK